MTLLVANRGEIALRIISSARELGLDTVAVYADDDADCPHVRAATEAIALPGSGPAAYLDQQAVLTAATSSGCALVHPGYGFLSENADFAQACAASGVTFVGPDPRVLRLFGDKSAARSAAVEAGVPVLPATEGGVTLAQVENFFADHPNGVMIKALAGGGGRGMRAVRTKTELAEAYRACAAEAALGFGNPDLFAEALCDGARHVEVQIVAAPNANGAATALALGDRDCSVQRRNQKLIELAPAQGLDPDTRRGLHAAAARLCAAAGYRGIATVEFLLTGKTFVFLEVNPRIQVEHTVTEEVTGVDLVAIQLEIARGAQFADLGLPAGIAAVGSDISGSTAAARGIAIQTRVNMETMTRAGEALPASGTLTAFAAPSGRGVRVDTFGRAGLAPSPRNDSLLAKVITSSAGDFASAVRKADAALGSFVIEGIATNIELLRAILSDKDFREESVHTGWLGERIGDLAGVVAQHHVRTPAPVPELHADEDVLRAHLGATVVEVAAEGDEVPAGAAVVVLESMKMQHVIVAPDAIEVVRPLVAPGHVVGPGDALVVLRRTGSGEAGARAIASTWTAFATISRRSVPGTTQLSMPRARLLWRSDTVWADEPHERTSTTWSTTGASSSTARSSSLPNAAGAASKT